MASKKLDAIKKRTIAEEKKNSWKSLCGSFNRTIPISTTWNNIKRFKRIKTSNKYCYDELIAPFFLKLRDNSFINTIDLNIYFDLHTSDNKSIHLLKPFTWWQLSISLKSRSFSTQGLDDFPYILMKN